MAAMTLTPATSVPSFTSAARSRRDETCARASTLSLRTRNVNLGTAVPSNLPTVFFGDRLKVAAFDKPLVSVSTKAASLRPGSAVARDRLGLDEWIASDQILVSNNGNFYVHMQPDNNLVLIDNRTGRRLWASNTLDPTDPGVTFAIMQADGNFVTYKRDVPTFASQTGGIPASFIVMQDDGNFVIYNAANKPTWASNTWQEDWQAPPPIMPQPPRFPPKGQPILRPRTSG